MLFLKNVRLLNFKTIGQSFRYKSKMSTFSQIDYNSAAYNVYRPIYGHNLYERIYSFHKSHNGQFDTALDVATGTGQVASKLSDSFKQVYATDLSSTMLQNAIKKSNITYSVSAAEDLSQISSNTIDLITVAQAAHWFNMTEFYKEAFRVLKPHGTLAMWGYSHNVLKDYPNAKEFMKSLIDNDDKLGPYWDERVKSINNLYKDFKIPEERFQNVERKIYDWDQISDTKPLLEVEWTISQLTKYYKTWSSYKNYLGANPNSLDLIDEHIAGLKQLIGKKDNERKYHEKATRYDTLRIVSENHPIKDLS